MARQNKLRNARPKVIFGIDGDIKPAVGLTHAISRPAQQQTDALQSQAKFQSDILKLKNENFNQNKNEIIDFITKQNGLERQLLNDIQMRLQMQTGNQNHIQRQNAGKIQLKNGGSARIRLRNMIDYNQFFLQGYNDNIPFTETDGGRVIPIFTNPEGFSLYKIIDNDQEHRYQERSGGNS